MLRPKGCAGKALPVHSARGYAPRRHEGYGLSGEPVCRRAACTVTAAAFLAGLTTVAHAVGSAEDGSGRSYQDLHHDRQYQPSGTERSTAVERDCFHGAADSRCAIASATLESRERTISHGC
jgi:hypothetical protein